MTPESLDAFRAHAAETHPRECCGLLAIVKGRERYWPCRNLEEGDGHFRMDAADYAAAEDAGEVIALCHSHPDCIDAVASEADRVVCETERKPSYILAWPLNKLTVITPEGYKAPLVGRQFFHGVLDCYALVRDWYAQEAGMELPQFERADNWWYNGGDLYMQNFAACGFAEVQGEPQRGDLFLMQIRSPVVNHAAVYLGDGLILHHLYGRLSSRDVYGGYWLERTRLHIRHENFPT